MQIGGASANTQVNQYAQTQARDANPVAAQPTPQESVQPQTPTAVSAAQKGLQNDQDKQQQSLQEQQIQAQQDAARNAQAANTNTPRGSIVNFTV